MWGITGKLEAVDVGSVFFSSQCQNSNVKTWFSLPVRAASEMGFGCLREWQALLRHTV